MQVKKQQLELDMEQQIGSRQEKEYVKAIYCHSAYLTYTQKTLESPLDCKEIEPAHSKGDQPGVFFGRTDAKAETPVFWPPHAKSWLIGKDSDAGRHWGQEEKGTTEDEIAGWYHLLDGHEFERTLGVGDGQGSLACCNSWGRKESDTTEWLNWTELNWEYIMRNAGLEETQAGIKISGRNINHLRYADDITLMADSEEELKSLLMKVKEESEKDGYTLGGNAN